MTTTTAWPADDRQIADPFGERADLSLSRCYRLLGADVALRSDSTELLALADAAYAGLPSGHATTAFSVLVAFGVLWPRARPVLLVYALLIVVSRVVVTAHYPTDVLAGALVGSVGVLMVRRYFALRRLGFAFGADGVPHAYPGPSLKRLKAVARGLLDK